MQTQPARHILEGIVAFGSFLFLAGALALSFLPDDFNLGKLLIMATPLPMIPATAILQNQALIGKQSNRLRTAFLWITFLLLDGVLVVLTMLHLRNGSPENLLLTFFLLLLAFIGFWFVLTCAMNLRNANTKPLMSIFGILSGITWILLIGAILFETVKPDALHSLHQALQVNMIVWAVSQAVWSLWLGIWLMMKKSSS